MELHLDNIHTVKNGKWETDTCPAISGHLSSYFWIFIQLFLDICPADFCPAISGLMSRNRIKIQKQDKNPEMTGQLSRNNWTKVSLKNFVILDKYPGISGQLSGYIRRNIQL